MAAPPFLPADISQIRVGPNSSPCAKANSAMATTDRFSEFIAWLMNEDGSLSDSAKEFFGTVGGGTAGGATLAAPSGVTATSDQTAFVRVTWNPVSAATSYTVFRGVSSDTATMEAITTKSDATPYEDTGAAVGTQYFYAVKASNATLISSFSAVAQGVRKSGVGFEPTVVADPSKQTEVVVPPGATTMKVVMWGGGGSGGDNAASSTWIPYTGGPTPPWLYGGGGSSGSLYIIESIPVTPGDVYVLAPGGPGLASFIYKTDFGNSVRAFATAGLRGGSANGSIEGGAGALGANDYGTNNLGGGTVNVADSSVGNDGTDGTTTAGLGGARLTYEGIGAGEGGRGSKTRNSFPDGGNGQIKVTFA